MKQLKKSFVLVLLVSSIFMTGCDANKVLDVISKISDGVQKAMPAVTSIANSFSSLCSNCCQTGCGSANSCASSCTTSSSCTDANVSVLDPNKEDASCSTTNTGTSSNCGNSTSNCGGN